MMKILEHVSRYSQRGMKTVMRSKCYMELNKSLGSSKAHLQYDFSVIISPESPNYNLCARKERVVPR